MLLALPAAPSPANVNVARQMHMTIGNANPIRTPINAQVAERLPFG
jgi:hypothetical protein